MSLENIPFNSSFENGYRNYNRFKNALEDSRTFEDVINAVEDATVEDSEGDRVVFDVKNYREDDEDTQTVLSAALVTVIKHLAEHGATHIDEIREMTGHAEVTTAVSRIIFNQ